MITTCIDSRFDQPGYKIYCNIEDLLLKAANGDNYDAELKFVTEFYGSDFDDYQLKTQLKVFSTDRAGNSESDRFLISLKCLNANTNLIKTYCLKFAPWLNCCWSCLQQMLLANVYLVHCEGSNLMFYYEPGEAYSSYDTPYS